jgi:hypothetical protein
VTGSGGPGAGSAASGAATDNASVSAIFATCFGSPKQAGGSGCGSSSEGARAARIKQAFLVSRHPSAVRCTPGPCPGSRVRIRPPSHSTTANSGGSSGRRAKASSVLGSASRRSARSPPTSCTTRSIVLAQAPESPTSLITIVARLKERVSAAEVAIRWTNNGVSSRASRPSGSRRGEEAPTTAGAVSDGLLHLEGSVDRGDPTPPAIESASSAAPGAPGGIGRVRGEVAHLAGLDAATELAPQLMRAGLDHRIMGDADDGALGVVQGHGDLRGLAQEVIESSLECGRRPIHGSTPDLPRSGPPERRGTALDHRMPRFSY